MVNKPRSKTSKDRTQDKRIAKLERLNPMVKEVVNNTDATTFSSTVDHKIVRLLPAAMDSEKVLMTGYNARFLLNAQLQDDTTAATRGQITRYILLIYKCSVNYVAGAGTVVPPTITDILNTNTFLPLANYNPDNKSRIRILFDRHINISLVEPLQMQSMSKTYKTHINFMPLTDKAFVFRPFLIKVAGGQSASYTFDVDSDFDLHTKQISGPTGPAPPSVAYNY